LPLTIRLLSEMLGLGSSMAPVPIRGRNVSWGWNFEPAPSLTPTALPDRGTKRISSLGLENYLIIPIYTSTKQAGRAFSSCLAMAPTDKQQGIEYGILCPNPAATDQLITPDCSKVRHFDLLPPDYLENLAAPKNEKKNLRWPHSTLKITLSNIRASVAQWLASPPGDLQSHLCCEFEPRHRRPGLTEGLKILSNITSYMKISGLKLVCLEEMNGTILYTSDTEMTFQRVDRVSLGESWPEIEEKKPQ
ncbi:hypothetical protein PoB_000914100, partial [Plakobranchus ocellatus]